MKVLAHGAQARQGSLAAKQRRACKDTKKLFSQCGAGAPEDVTEIFYLHVEAFGLSSTQA